MSIIKTSLGLKVSWLSVRMLFSAWISFLLQQSQHAETEVCHIMAAAAPRVTVKVNKCLLRRTVQTGRAMSLLTLLVIRREMLHCVQRHSFVSLWAAKHAWTWRPVSDRGVEGDKIGASLPGFSLGYTGSTLAIQVFLLRRNKGKSSFQPF